MVIKPLQELAVFCLGTMHIQTLERAGCHSAPSTACLLCCVLDIMTQGSLDCCSGVAARQDWYKSKLAPSFMQVTFSPLEENQLTLAV